MSIHHLCLDWQYNIIFVSSCVIFKFCKYLSSLFVCFKIQITDQNIEQDKAQAQSHTAQLGTVSIHFDLTGICSEIINPCVCTTTRLTLLHFCSNCKNENLQSSQLKSKWWQHFLLSAAYVIVRLPVNRRLLVVNFLRVKSFTQAFDHPGVSAPTLTVFKGQLYFHFLVHSISFLN